MGALAQAYMRTPASDDYAEAVIQARLQTDAAWLQKHSEADLRDLASARHRCSGSTLMAEMILQLATNDTSRRVRRLGLVSVSCVPQQLLESVPWCPSLHIAFDLEARSMVRCLLMLAARRSDGLPIAKRLILMYVLPMACHGLADTSNPLVAPDWIQELNWIEPTH